MTNTATGPRFDADPVSIELANEFAAVRITLDRQARGARLEVLDLESGDRVYLDAVQLASLCRADEDQRRAWLRTGEYNDAAPSPLPSAALSSDSAADSAAGTGGRP